MAKSATATVKVSGSWPAESGKLFQVPGHLPPANKATPTPACLRKQEGGSHGLPGGCGQGGLIGYGTVNGLENSAKVLGNNVKDNSVKIVITTSTVERRARCFGEALHRRW